MDPEILYRQLGRLIEGAPDFSGYGPATTDQLVWLGRAHALIQESGDLVLKTEFSIASNSVQGPSRQAALKAIMLILYKTLAAAELKAPPSAQGAFIPAGNRFDAFAAITKILASATADAFIVDPYLDESLLTDFGSSVAAGIPLRIMSDSGTVRPNLAAAASMWSAQHGASRPLSYRLASPKALHDRAIFVDGKIAWLLTQSFKDFAKRSPAEIVRADDTAALKIAAYEAIWTNATVVV